MPDDGAPRGGEPIDLMASSDERSRIRHESRDIASWSLTPQQLDDLEMLLMGGYWPLTGFMDRADSQAVASNMRLQDGTPWPTPITLKVSSDLAAELAAGSDLALRDAEGILLAILHINDVWEFDPDSPGVGYVGEEHRPTGRPATRRYHVGGTLTGIELPVHYDFRAKRLTPVESRKAIEERGWSRVLGFMTEGVIHRAGVEASIRASQSIGANLLIAQMIGSRTDQREDHYARIRAAGAVVDRYLRDEALHVIIPYRPRTDGPRESILRTIVARNYGCTEIMAAPAVGVAGDGSTESGPLSNDLDGLRSGSVEAVLPTLPYEPSVFVPEREAFVPEREVVPGLESASTFTDRDLMERLADGESLPEGYTYPEVELELRKWHPPRSLQGFTVFFTGLSGSGKSTLANILRVRLLESGRRSITLLDGDVVRKHLSSELGFTREDRDTNVRRIGFVASEVTKSGGIAICAPIAPYDAARKAVRRRIAASGGFVLVHVATPMAVCEARDRKGLYAKARAGMIDRFTGISDPYEEPLDAEVVIDTTATDPLEGADQILRYLIDLGYVTHDTAI